MDRSTFNKAQLKAEVRERKVGPDGSIGGPTSWCESVSPDRIRDVLAAADAGVTLEASSVPASTSNAASVAEAAQALMAAMLANATPQAAPLDRDAIASIVREEVRASGTLSIVVTHAATGATVDIGRQHPRFPVAFAFVKQGKAITMVGPRGTGKSEAARAMATALGVPFYPFSCAADRGTHELFGFVHATGGYVETDLFRAYKHGGLFCLDEADRAAADFLTACNLPLANGHCTFANGECVTRHPNFRFVATANGVHGATNAYAGASIDASFLDRARPVAWPIDESFEAALARATAKAAADAASRDYPEAEVERWIAAVKTARTAADSAGLDRVSPSPRATIDGAEMLASGAITWHEAASVIVLDACDTDSRSRLAPAFKAAK